MGGSGHITLRGVSVHNLQKVDLDLPHRQLIVFCGVSGSGKSSLALDTLYAEGQRRYIESFSAYTRQFLQRLEKPDAERIDGIPPAIAVTGRNTSRSSRSTVGTATETSDYLRLLFAKIGRVFCQGCGREVRRDTPQNTAEMLAGLPPGTRYLLAFPWLPPNGENASQATALLKEDGFVRVVAAGRMIDLTVEPLPAEALPAGTPPVDTPESTGAPPSTAAAFPPAKDAAAIEFPSEPAAGAACGSAPAAEAAEEAEADEFGAEENGEEEQADVMVSAALLGGDEEVDESLEESRPAPRRGSRDAADAEAEGNFDEEHARFLRRATAAFDNAIAAVPARPAAAGNGAGGIYVIVDRLTAGSTADDRIRDSLETAFAQGRGRCYAFIAELPADGGTLPPGQVAPIDGRSWRRVGFSTQLACEDCGRQYPPPEPRLYSFNSPLGACPECEGFGNIIDTDMELVVPDPNKSLRDGAIAPWSSPAYNHELTELLTLAPDYDIPTDVPYAQLTDQQRRLILGGVPERNFGGLAGFFAWLERRKYKMHIRVFLSRWRSYRPCPTCGGSRLRSEALATQIGGRNIAQLCALKICDLTQFLAGLELTPWQQQVGRMMLDQVRARLSYLEDVGLGYLSLDRTLRTLSGGEARRVALTSALGSSLVNMLYVLDEPSVGLHPRDVSRLVTAIESLRNRGNTVVVVEHEEAMIRSADQVVEIGPGAGERGGRVIFQGTPKEMEKSSESVTGDYMAGRRGISAGTRRRAPEHGWLRLAGARGNNLRDLTLEFPLGVLCLVTGVSGSGKSTLVQDTLYPALCRRLRKEAPKPQPFGDIFGDGQIDDVIMVDQSPIGRSPRSNPVTYLKAFDEIRNVFAETVEARTRNFSASQFSFNVDGGRCSVCEGEGYLQIDMQFLADVYMKCSQCNGTRYRDEILDITYRGRNIAEVLEMTVREAFTFFRGRPKVQARLKRLIDVGLDYVRLGQPANTLSGGEAQRLKLAGYMSTAKRGRCLFILDEPTTGLHFSDIVQLLDCFDALLAVGHSLIVVEHNLQVMKAADYIIDLGPGAADEGGRIVAKGTPEMIARQQGSITGRYLAEVLGSKENGNGNGKRNGRGKSSL